MMMMVNECMECITLRGAAPDLKKRNVIAWYCECGVHGEYWNKLRVPPGFFRHEKPVSALAKER